MEYSALELWIARLPRRVWKAMRESLIMHRIWWYGIVPVCAGVLLVILLGQHRIFWLSLIALVCAAIGLKQWIDHESER